MLCLGNEVINVRIAWAIPRLLSEVPIHLTARSENITVTSINLIKHNFKIGYRGCAGLHASYLKPGPRGFRKSAFQRDVLYLRCKSKIAAVIQQSSLRPHGNESFPFRRHEKIDTARMLTSSNHRMVILLFKKLDVTPRRATHHRKIVRNNALPFSNVGQLSVKPEPLICSGGIIIVFAAIKGFATVTEKDKVIKRVVCDLALKIDFLFSISGRNFSSALAEKINRHININKNIFHYLPLPVSLLTINVILIIRARHISLNRRTAVLILYAHWYAAYLLVDTPYRSLR